MTPTVLENIGSAENLIGFELLTEEDQERVLEAFEQGAVPEWEEADKEVSSRGLITGLVHW